MASMSGVPVPGLSLTAPSADAFSVAGKSVAVVGGTGGLGRALARFLASKGAQVTVVGQTFRDAGVPGLHFLQADLSRMVEAQRVATALPAGTLDALIFTTGIISAPQREVTSEGLERDLAISTLSRVVILRGVADRLGTERADRTQPPRVFVMGFPGTGQLGNPDDLNAEQAYAMMPVHMNTVAGNEALVLDAARRYPQLGVYGLNPGLIRTDIRANALGGLNSLRFRIVESLIGLFTPTPDAYAARLAPKLFAPELTAHSGVHLNQKGVAIQPSVGLTEAHATRWLSAADALLARVGVA